MKRLLVLLMMVMMLFSVVACQKKEETVVEEPETVETETEKEPEVVVGGWSVSESYNEYLSEEEKQNFESALEGLVGVSYKPVKVIATQLVSGTNYAYLAQGTTVTATPATDYYVIVVYKNLEGKCELTSINKIDLANIETTEQQPENLMGSWKVEDTGKAMMLADENAQASFDKALEGLTGVQYNPIALLGSQVVNGTNYKALCLGKTVTAEAVVGLYVVEWNAATDGSASLLDIKNLNLEYYLTKE